MSPLEKMALWLALVLVTILLAMHQPRSRSVPAPTVQVDTLAVPFATVDSSMLLALRQGEWVLVPFRVRCLIPHGAGMILEAGTVGAKIGGKK